MYHDKKSDVWSKQLSDGRAIEYLFLSFVESQGKTKSLAYARVEGVVLAPSRGLAIDLTRSQVEALFENAIKDCAPVAGNGDKELPSDSIRAL
jgi:hypothetical protein